ncbi:hypothetical protein OIU84_018631 [Salix udensis]|uniref:Uncharacterized protein n=1 Tax=Salix udensis TaxID=889485 RepID=A0AAD6KWV6_9ROSI|nr:hypothetical protein OIU84_018631 [Salix udensis]
MGSWNSASAAILAVLALLSSILALDLDHTTENEGVGRRALLSFKETPHGTNLTFDCSPSGPCVPCAYSEKSDKKYRCSETGHRIPFKCVEINHDSNIEKGKQRSPNGRSAVEISDDPRADHRLISLTEAVYQLIQRICQYLVLSNEVVEEENNVWRREKRKITQGCNSESKPNTCNSIIKVP